MLNSKSMDMLFAPMLYVWKKPNKSSDLHLKGQITCYDIHFLNAHLLMDLPVNIFESVSKSHVCRIQSKET